MGLPRASRDTSLVVLIESALQIVRVLGVAGAIRASEDVDKEGLHFHPIGGNRLSTHLPFDSALAALRSGRMAVEGQKARLTPS